MNISQKNYVFKRIDSICDQLFYKFNLRLEEELGITDFKTEKPYEDDETKVVKALTDLVSGKIKPDKFPYVLSEGYPRYTRLYELLMKKEEFLKNKEHNKKMCELERKKEALKAKARKRLDREALWMKDNVMLGDSESVIASLESFSKVDLWKAVS